MGREPKSAAASEVTMGIGKVSLVADQSLPSGKEQIALIIDQYEAQLSLNSGFMEPTGLVARLGLFRAPISPALLALRSELQRYESELSRRDAGYSSMSVRPLDPRGNPHQVHIRIGGKSLRSELKIRKKWLRCLPGFGIRLPGPPSTRSK